MLLTSQWSIRAVRQKFFHLFSGDARYCSANTMVTFEIDRRYVGSVPRNVSTWSSRSTSEAKRSCLSIDYEQKDQSLHTKVYSKVNTEWLRVYSVSLADHLARKMTEVLDKNAVVLEGNAGLGLVSKCLLQNGIKHLVAFEPDERFDAVLRRVRNEYEGSFKFFNWRIQNVLQYDENFFYDELAKNVSRENGNTVQIVGVLKSTLQLVVLLRSLIRVECFLNGKHMRMCICLPESLWLQFADMKNNKRQAVDRALFHVVFETEILDTFLAAPFFPRKNNTQKTHDSMVLFQIRSKELDFDIMEMHFFLSEFYNRLSYRKCVIPSLEKWSPSCGEELLKKGLSIYTKFCDLSSDQLVDVFTYFRTLPIYEIYAARTGNSCY